MLIALLKINFTICRYKKLPIGIGSFFVSGNPFLKIESKAKTKSKAFFPRKEIEPAA